MIVKFNSLDRFEMPKFTLCNPGCVYSNGYLSNVIGDLIDHEAEEIAFNFNSPSELNIRFNRVIRTGEDDLQDYNNDNIHAFDLYDAIQNRRLIFVDDIGFFMISSITNGLDGNRQYKDVRADSIEVELQQKMIPFIQDGTYALYNPSYDPSDSMSGNPGILNLLMPSLPLWQIGHIDNGLLSNDDDKHRTFEDVGDDINCLSFLISNIQEAFECIVLFDCANRLINVYDQDNYVRDTDVQISRDDVVQSINVSENADDIYTAIRVTGDNDLTIAAVNPLGTSVIYNFNHYLSWMSEGLGEKVSAWQNEMSFEARASSDPEFENNYYHWNLKYYRAMTDVSTYEFETQRIDILLTLYRRCRENIVADSSAELVGSYNEAIISNGGDPVVIANEIADTLSHIDNLISGYETELDGAEANLAEARAYADNYHNEAEAIRQRLTPENYFTAVELSELSNYIFEGTYSDEYVTITDIMSWSQKFMQMRTLYRRAASTLKKASVPTQEFSVDTDDFIFAKDFLYWSNQLETGCLINVEIRRGDVAKLFLSNITINYDDKKTQLTFGNRFNKFDVKSLFDNVLGKINKSASTLSYIKDLVKPMSNGDFNYMQSALQSSRDITMNTALASTGEEVVIDGSGYTGRRVSETGEVDPHQVKLTGRSLVFTDDAWDSCRVAVGELQMGNGDVAYGINAEAIIGDMIIGNGLKIVDNSGNDLLSVVDGKISAQVDDLDGRLSLLEQTADGISIRISDLEDRDVDHVVTSTGYTFDADGLWISRSGDEIVNKLDNTGMYVIRQLTEPSQGNEDETTEETVLSANTDGVNALNLSARQYLIIGKSSRFEDYESNRTACFYVAEDSGGET